MSSDGIGRVVKLDPEGVEALQAMLERRDKLIRLNGCRAIEPDLTEVKTLKQVPIPASPFHRERH